MNPHRTAMYEKQAGGIMPSGVQCHNQTTEGQDGAEKPHIMPIVYRVEDIAQMLDVSTKTAYNLCNSTREFKVLRVGNKIRVSKASFDEWLARSC